MHGSVGRQCPLNGRACLKDNPKLRLSGVSHGVDNLDTVISGVRALLLLGPVDIAHAEEYTQVAVKKKLNEKITKTKIV